MRKPLFSIFEKVFVVPRNLTSGNLARFYDEKVFSAFYVQNEIQEIVKVGKGKNSFYRYLLVLGSEKIRFWLDEDQISLIKN